MVKQGFKTGKRTELDESVTDGDPFVRRRITESYEESLRTFVDLHPRITDWDVPTPCGNWTLIDLSGHLLDDHPLLAPAPQCGGGWTTLCRPAARPGACGHERDGLGTAARELRS